jgi:hypothetical protein
VGSKLILLLLISLCVVVVTNAQSGGRLSEPAAQAGPITPERGSPERKAILDALRGPVEKQLRQSVVFKVNHLKLQNGWAFLLGVPQQPDGNAIDYSGTAYAEAQEAGAFDDGIVALLHLTGGKWRVVQYVIGATDVPYVDWNKKYRAPKAIFPMP